MSVKGYNWCFTISYDKFKGMLRYWYELQNIKNMMDENIKYLIIGEEWAKKDNGEIYHHYQGYIQMKGQNRRKAMKTVLNCDSTHLELQSPNSTNEEARNYCWKGQFETKGTEFPQPSSITYIYGTFCEGQGSRTDLIKIKQDLDNGREHYDIVQDRNKFLSYGRYHSWFFKYKQLRDDDEYNIMREIIETIVIYGESGTGKTTSILNREGVKNVYILSNSNGDNKNWNGYTNQKILLIDDFYGWIRLNEMLRILDNKPYRVRKLHGYEWAKWTKIYITANTSPTDWYDETFDREIMTAFYSRITKCLKVSKGNTGTLLTSLEILSTIDRHNQSEYLDLDKIECLTKCLIE